MNSALPQVVTTGPDSKLNSTAIDIFTLYAQMDSSFWIETINFSLYTLMGEHWSQVIISKQNCISFSEDCFCLSKQSGP